MREKMQRFMWGRYGTDRFNQFLMVCAMVCLLISFFGGGVFYLVATAVMVYAYFRMFSRNLTQRRSENQKWVNWLWRARNRKARHADKEHKYFTCKACKTICRVPVGKGAIIITCPKCGAKIKAKT